MILMYQKDVSRYRRDGLTRYTGCISGLSRCNDIMLHRTCFTSYSVFSNLMPHPLSESCFAQASSMHDVDFYSRRTCISMSQILNILRSERRNEHRNGLRLRKPPSVQNPCIQETKCLILCSATVANLDVELGISKVELLL